MRVRFPSPAPISLHGIPTTTNVNPGEVRKSRDTLGVQGIFGGFPLSRDYYYHQGKNQGHYPADDALGLEVSYTPALAKLLCLEAADEQTYLKAERHLQQTGGISVSARQIQRVVQRIGAAAQQWQERTAEPAQCERADIPILYVSADGTGIPMVPEELVGRTEQGRLRIRRDFERRCRDETGHRAMKAVSPKTGEDSKATWATGLFP